MKKEIPLKLLEIVEKFIKENIDCITFKIDKDTYYTIIDKDKTSNFYFKIFKKKPDNISISPPPLLFIEKSPKTEDDISPVIIGGDYIKLNRLLTEWVSIIKKYNSIDSIFDDPILNSYQKDFYAQYVIIDDDANYEPFNTNQLLFLENYLTNLERNIEKYKNEENEKVITEIITDTKLLKDELTQLSKNQVIKKLTIIWAKMQKESLKLIKEFVIEAKKEFFKYIIKKAIDVSSGGRFDLLQ